MLSDGAWAQVSNSILWGNDNAAINGNPEIAYSCIEGGYPGMGNINLDPLFIQNGPFQFLLSQTVAGQSMQSPCVDAGDPAAAMLIGTTRTDGAQDSIIVDMGYHYPIFSQQAILVLSTQRLEFEAALEGHNPEVQTFQIANGFVDSFYYAIAEDIPWASIDPISGGPVPPTTTITVSINASGLPIGIYEGDVAVMAEGAQGSPDSVHVTLEISLPALLIEPDSLLFSCSAMGSPPTDQTFTISNAGPGLYYYSISDSIDWVTVSPMSGGPIPPSATVTVAVNPINFQYGTYRDTIYVVAEGAIGSPWPVPIILDITSDLLGNLSGLLPSGQYVAENINVDAGDSLILAPPSTILFRENCGFNIYGHLWAIGTQLDSILFDALDSAVGWEGMQFYSYSDSSQLSYCRISHSASGGLTSTSADLHISHCSFTGNGGDNGGGISSSNSNLEIDSCLFTDNYAFTGGGIGSSSACSLYVSNCTFAFNQASGAGAAINHNANCYLAMDRCTIYGNSGGGLAFGVGNTLEIKNSIIADNDTFPGLLIVPPSVSNIDHNNIFANSAGNFSGQLPPNFGQITTTNLNGDSCDVYHNIFLDPLFLNPDSGDFHLTAESPCIDAGDLATPPDPDGSIADMGAFYFDQSVGIADPADRFIPETYFLEGNHPNPFNPTTTITFGLPVASWVKVEVFDIAGRIVTGKGARSAPLQGWREAGVHEVTFDGSDLSSGIYILRLQAGDFSAVKKLILLK